jgi:hypothetical protein
LNTIVNRQPRQTVRSAAAKANERQIATLNEDTIMRIKPFV